MMIWKAAINTPDINTVVKRSSRTYKEKQNLIDLDIRYDFQAIEAQQPIKVIWHRRETVSNKD